MGASAKKKKEKKQDFKKTKLKVGKAKPKPLNFTDTSFKAKAIVINGQFHHSTGPEAAIRAFKHHLSQASSARVDRQRRDALASLALHLSSRPPFNPVGTRTILTRLLPLLSDTSAQVRAQLLTVLRTLPAAEVRPDAARAAVFIRAALTHLSAAVAADALAALGWLLDLAAAELVAGPAGWLRTITTLCALLGWSITSSSGWTASTRSALRPASAIARAAQVAALSRLLQAGLCAEEGEVTPQGQVQRGLQRRLEWWNGLYQLPQGPQPFEHLNLYGAARDEDGEMYSHRGARVRVFCRRFLAVVRAGIELERREGGALGRAAVDLEQVLVEGLEGAQEIEGTGPVSTRLGPPRSSE